MWARLFVCAAAGVALGLFVILLPGKTARDARSSASTSARTRTKTTRKVGPVLN
jgi:hypothetical protein